MTLEILKSLAIQHVWLPPNTTWEDVAPGPDKRVVYPDNRHLLCPPLFALVLLGLRRAFEMYLFAPLGRCLGMKNTKSKKPATDIRLETAYRTWPNVLHEEMGSLAKRLETTERSLRRWWRRRRAQDKTTRLAKFCEIMWRFTFYSSNVSYGLYTLWDKEWLWDVDQCYLGYPRHGVSDDVWWYYMVSAAFYWSQALTQFTDVRRSDFWLLAVHHAATVAVLCASWLSRTHRAATLGLLLHDCTDVFLEMAKAAKYANWQRACDLLFGVFLILWVVCRLWLYPFYVVWSTLFRAPMLIPVFPAYYVINSLLCILLALNLAWTRLIAQVAYRAIRAKRTEGDVRSSGSEESDSSHPSDHSAPDALNKTT